MAIEDNIRVKTFKTQFYRIYNVKALGCGVQATRALLRA